MPKNNFKTQHGPRLGGTSRCLALAAVAGLAACGGPKEVVKPQPVVQEVAPPPELTAADYFAQGLQALHSNNVVGAKDGFQKAVDKDPKLAVAHFDLGLLDEQAGDLGATESEYKAALEADPDHLSAILNLGHLYRLKDQFDKAIALYTKALGQHKYDVK